MERTQKSVEDHLAGLEGSRGDDIRALDKEIRARMPNAEVHLYEGKFWGGTDQQIVGYGVVDYKNISGNKVEWFLVGLAEQKNYISMYVNAVKGGSYLLKEYAKRLGKAKVGSASISFDGLDNIDTDALFELLEEAAAS